MSQENVEIVRRWTDAYNGRDMDGLVQLTDPTFEMKSIFAGLESGGYFRAYDGFPFGYFKLLDEAYERFLVLPTDDLIDAGAAVVMPANAVWRGKASGAEGSLPIFPAFWLMKGRVFREETYSDRAEALEAVGLSE